MSAESRAPNLHFIIAGMTLYFIIGVILLLPILMGHLARDKAPSPWKYKYFIIKLRCYPFFYNSALGPSRQAKYFLFSKSIFNEWIWQISNCYLVRRKLGGISFIQKELVRLWKKPCKKVIHKSKCVPNHFSISRR